ncbi:MAG: helix-turn-helix domain-containing protein [Solirubrobacterales bacterium]|nr:helix-turn-helix domain-containing protein [Solirubrobacterales bacterium]
MPDQRAEALAMRDAGRDIDDIAAHFEVNKATVYRWINAAKDGPGPTERSARALIATWGELDETRSLVAETMLTYAVTADKGRRATVGVMASAGVAAAKELDAMTQRLGQSSGFEELTRALLEA